MLLMTLAGTVRVALHCDPRTGIVRSADVTLRRPSVAPLLIGRSPQEAIDLVGTLHSVCGAAHRLAATRALRAARGRCDDASEAALERAALIEIALDHLCRLYIDWPQALGLPPDPPRALAWRRRLAPSDLQVAAADIDAVRQHARCLAEAAPAMAGIRQRLQRRARKTVACLTAIKLEADRPGKIRTLVTPGGARSRQAGLPAEAQRANAGATPWQGEGRTYTARGELIHRVSLRRDASGQERTAAWNIDAPTDRLFAPDGPVARALTQLPAAGASLPLAARCLVLSFDPCVESRIEIHAA